MKPKLIVVVGAPKSRTHYASAVFLNHPEVHGSPLGHMEPWTVHVPLTEEKFHLYVESLHSGGVYSVNNHRWSYHCDIIKSHPGVDSIIVETRREPWDWLYRSVQRFYNDLFHRKIWEYGHVKFLRDIGEPLDKGSCSFPEIMAALLYASRKAIRPYRDFLLDEDNFKETVIEIQKACGLNVVPFEELTRPDRIGHLPGFYIYDGHDMKYDPNKYRYKRDKLTDSLIRSNMDRVKYWMDKALAID